MPALAGPVSAPDADLVLLVKPQFEAGRAAVSRGKGVVRDPAVWLGALEGVVSALHDAGTGIMGAMASPLTGAAGNVEFLLHARKGAPGSDADEAAALLSAAVSEAEGHLTAGRPGRLSRARPMATITFLVHPDRPDALALATDTAAWLKERGHVARILRFSGPDRVSEAGVEIDLAAVDLAGTVGRRQHGRGRHVPARGASGGGRGRARPRCQLRSPGLPARPPARSAPRRPDQGARRDGRHRATLRARRVHLGPFDRR